MYMHIYSYLWGVMKDSSNSVQSGRLISILGSIYGFRVSAWLWLHTCKSDYPERICAHTVLTFLSWCNGTLVENSHKIFGVCQNPLIISVVEEKTEKQLHFQSCFFSDSWCTGIFLINLLSEHFGFLLRSLLILDIKWLAAHLIYAY